MWNSHKGTKQIAEPSGKQLLQQEQGKYINACKICLFPQNVEAKESNQLISPCSCTGSMKYTHQDCINKWIEIKYLEKSQVFDKTNC